MTITKVSLEQMLAPNIQGDMLMPEETNRAMDFLLDHYASQGLRQFYGDLDARFLPVRVPLIGMEGPAARLDTVSQELAKKISSSIRISRRRYDFVNIAPRSVTPVAEGGTVWSLNVTQEGSKASLLLMPGEKGSEYIKAKFPELYRLVQERRR